MKRNFGNTRNWVENRVKPDGHEVGEDVAHRIIASVMEECTSVV